MSNRHLSPAERKLLSKRVEQSMSNAAVNKKQSEKLTGRSSPHSRVSHNASGPTKNGDLKPTSGSRPSSAANSKPPTPWQRPKVTPASAYNRNNSSPKYGKAVSSRVNSGQQRTNSPSNNPSKPLPSNVRSRPRAVTTVENNKKTTSPLSSESRARSTSSPSSKAKEASSKIANQKPASNEKLAVSFKSGEDSVAMPEIKETPPTLELKKKESGPKDNKEEKLLAVPKRSRAHVMPISKTSKREKKGHDFQPHELTEWVNWCDACGSIILSLFGKCVCCKKCKMVCHAKCALTVALTCEADEVRAMTQIDPSWYKTIVEETKDESTLKEYNTIHRVMPPKEIKARIEGFNKTVKSTQQMTLQEDGETFRGFIRVTMNLARPVSVADDNKDRKKLQRSSSFYVNKGAVKALYLSSNTTAEEVVAALLNKYGIRDNPLKFALFEKQVREEGHIILRKMMTRERPLFLRLLWGDGNTQQHAFILQENESREIQWESFSLPELYTFLKILEKEQDDHITCIKTKFTSRRQDIVNAMNYRKKQGGKG